MEDRELPLVIPFCLSRHRFTLGHNNQAVNGPQNAISFRN